MNKMLPLSVAIILSTLVFTIECQQVSRQSTSNNQNTPNQQSQQQQQQPQQQQPQLLSLQQQQQLLQQLSVLQAQAAQLQAQQAGAQQQQQQQQPRMVLTQTQPQAQPQPQQFTYVPQQQSPQQQFFDPQQPPQQFFDPNQQGQGISPQQFLPQPFVPQAQSAQQQQAPAPAQPQPTGQSAPQISWGKCPQLEPSDKEKMTKAAVITKCLETTPLPGNITRDTVELHREQIAACALQSEGWFTSKGGYDFGKAENEIRNKKLAKQIEEQVLNYHKQCQSESEEKFPPSKSNVIGQIQLYQACMDYFISDVCGIEVNEPEPPQFTGPQFQ